MKQELQEQTNIIQEKILLVAGILKLNTMMKQPPSESLQDDLGEALMALQEIRKEFVKEYHADGT